MTAGADKGAMSHSVVTVVPAKQAGLKGAPHWAVSLGVTDQLAVESTEELMDL